MIAQIMNHIGDGSRKKRFAGKKYGHTGRISGVKEHGKPEKSNKESIDYRKKHTRTIRIRYGDIKAIYARILTPST